MLQPIQIQSKSVGIKISQGFFYQGITGLRVQICVQREGNKLAGILQHDHGTSGWDKCAKCPERRGKDFKRGTGTHTFVYQSLDKFKREPCFPPRMPPRPAVPFARNTTNVATSPTMVPLGTFLTRATSSQSVPSTTLPVTTVIPATDIAGLRTNPVQPSGLTLAGPGSVFRRSTRSILRCPTAPGASFSVRNT